MKSILPQLHRVQGLEPAGGALHRKTRLPTGWPVG